MLNRRLLLTLSIYVINKLTISYIENSWFATTLQGGHVGVNTIEFFSK